MIHKKSVFQRHSTILLQNFDHLAQNSFKTINSQLLNHQETQKRAQQSLLQMEYQPHSQTKNPQANFMALTKNVRFNTFQKPKRSKKNQDQQDFIPKDQFRRTRSNMNKYSNLALKEHKYELKSGRKSEIPSIDQQDQKKVSLNDKIQNLFSRTKSNLLTPRQSLPTIYSSQNHFSVLARKTKSFMKPYSSGKNNNLKLSSIIKLRQQLSILPALDKQLRRRRISGYD